MQINIHYAKLYGANFAYLQKITLKMASKGNRKKERTVFVCVSENAVIGVASSLLRLVNKTNGMQGRNYYYYRRQLGNGSECNVMNGEKVLKIQKVDYD